MLSTLPPLLSKVSVRPCIVNNVEEPYVRVKFVNDQPYVRVRDEASVNPFFRPTIIHTYSFDISGEGFRTSSTFQEFADFIDADNPIYYTHSLNSISKHTCGIVYEFYCKGMGTSYSLYLYPSFSPIIHLLPNATKYIENASSPVTSYYNIHNVDVYDFKVHGTYLS